MSDDDIIQENKGPKGPREQVYDAEIAPLVRKLRKIAEANNLPLIVFAELDTHPEKGVLQAVSSSAMEHSTSQQTKVLAFAAHGKAPLVPVSVGSDGNLHAAGCDCEDKDTPPKGKCN